MAPDLARGAMLLLIALANASGVVFGGTGLEPQPQGVERWLNLVMTTLVHARAYPVFAVMFGYGIAQLAARQAAAGATPREIRAVLLRRHAWLFAFGATHALLLYYGDFLGAYGIIGTLATLLLVDRGERVHRIVIWLWVLTAVHVAVLAALVAWSLESGGGAGAAVPRETVASLVASSYVASLLARAREWPVHTLAVVPAIVITWLGLWAGRHRVLEEARTQRRALAIVAATGLAIAWTGALPLGLAAAGFLQADDRTMTLLVRLHQVSGMFGGPGYGAAIALVAIAVERRRPRVIDRAAAAVAALGRRSLSGYLFQSLAWLALFSPFTLHLGGRAASPLAMSLVAASLVWVASVQAAVAMERRGYRGPAEIVLRRLVYGTPRPATTAKEHPAALKP